MTRRNRGHEVKPALAFPHSCSPLHPHSWQTILTQRGKQKISYQTKICLSNKKGAFSSSCSTSHLTSASLTLFIYLPICLSTCPSSTHAHLATWHCILKKRMPNSCLPPCHLSVVAWCESRASCISMVSWWNNRTVLMVLCGTLSLRPCCIYIVMTVLYSDDFLLWEFVLSLCWKKACRVRCTFLLESNNDDHQVKTVVNHIHLNLLTAHSAV